MRRLLTIMVLILGLSTAGLFGQQGRAWPSTDTRGLLGVAATPSQRAVFAPFAAALCITSPCPVGTLDTAISISNTLAAPPGIVETFDDLFADREGTVELYMWDTFGHLLFYETALDSPGIGLVREAGREGFLAPGESWRVLLSEILDIVDYTQHEIDFDHVDGIYAGYIWVVANFDGVQGTTNLTDFATFTQALVLQPDLGSTFFDFDADAGVPIIPPPDEPDNQ